MDDIGTAIAADASGNGNPGVFLVGSALGAPGPESGTFCMAGSQGNAGVQIEGTDPLTGTGPWTLSCWFGSSSMTSSNLVLVYTGLSNSTGAGLALQATVVVELLGGLAVLSTGFALTAGFWHQLIYTLAPLGFFDVWVDGVRRSHRLTFGVVNPVIASNPLLAQTPDPGLLAHAAFWTRVLTDAEITSLWATGPGSVVAPPLSGRNATDADVLALENKLDRILTSVRRVY